MAHHKRRKRKDIRAGCLMCKPHKSNCNKGSEAHQTWQERRARLTEREQRQDLYRSSDRGVVEVAP